MAAKVEPKAKNTPRIRVIVEIIPKCQRRLITETPQPRITPPLAAMVPVKPRKDSENRKQGTIKSTRELIAKTLPFTGSSPRLGRVAAGRVPRFLAVGESSLPFYSRQHHHLHEYR